MNNLIKKLDKRPEWIPHQKTYKWKMSIWKDASHHIIREMQTKIHHTFILAKIQTLTTPRAGENVEQQELLFIAGGSSRWYSFLQN